MAKGKMGRNSAKRLAERRSNPVGVFAREPFWIWVDGVKTINSRGLNDKFNAQLKSVQGSRKRKNADEKSQQG